MGRIGATGSAEHAVRSSGELLTVPDRSDTNAIGSEVAAGPEQPTRSHDVDADGCRPAVASGSHELATPFRSIVSRAGRRASLEEFGASFPLGAVGWDAVSEGYGINTDQVGDGLRRRGAVHGAGIEYPGALRLPPSLSYPQRLNEPLEVRGRLAVDRDRFSGSRMGERQMRRMQRNAIDELLRRFFRSILPV